MSGATSQLPVVMTVAEFLAWNPPDGDRWELIDGTPCAMAPSVPRHGAIQAETARLIGNHLAEKRPDCRVITGAGIQPKVRANHNTRVPDLAVVCGTRDPGETLLHDPLVLIEILSPSHQTRTWSNVWSYTTIPSVREILILHTDIRADLLRREGDGSWPDDPIPLTLGDMVTLDSIGLTLPIAAFYRTT